MATGGCAYCVCTMCTVICTILVCTVCVLYGCMFSYVGVNTEYVYYACNILVLYTSVHSEHTYVCI